VNLTDVGPFTGPLLFSTALALLLVGLAWLLRRQAPWLTCALGIYTLGILPVSGLVAHGDWLRGADRYAYMPLVGFWIVIGAAVTAKPLTRELGFGDLRSRSVVMALLVVLVTWGITTFRVTRHWGSDETLWSYTLEVDPANRVALQNLGTLYMSQQRYEEALPLFSSALRLDPGHNIAVPLNLGVALQNLDRAQEAVRVYQSALLYKPRSAELHNNLAAAYWNLGDRQQAEVHLRLSKELQAEAATQR
jgi:tetratricopeptide (TPR) repeat protein